MLPPALSYALLCSCFDAPDRPYFSVVVANNRRVDAGTVRSVGPLSIPFAKEIAPLQETCHWRVARLGAARCRAAGGNMNPSKLWHSPAMTTASNNHRMQDTNLAAVAHFTAQHGTKLDGNSRADPAQLPNSHHCLYKHTAHSPRPNPAAALPCHAQHMKPMLAGEHLTTPTTPILHPATADAAPGTHPDAAVT